MTPDYVYGQWKTHNSFKIPHAVSGVCVCECDWVVCKQVRRRSSVMLSVKYCLMYGISVCSYIATQTPPLNRITFTVTIKACNKNFINDWSGYRQRYVIKYIEVYRLSNLPCKHLKMVSLSDEWSYFDLFDVFQ